jgi:Leucine-rich repeat (LRR) protein
MTTKVFFNDTIREAIIKELQKAEHEIYAAVAWFNDSEIFSILVDKASDGKKVELLISNDPNNFGETNSLKFNELIEKGGKVNRLITENVLMHNKFCVIDNHTLITGSYNWTFGAYYKNLENIVIIENDIKLCETFKAEFNRILSEYFTYIQDFDSLLQRISDRVNELREQNKSGLLDPNWIMNILNKNQGQYMLTDGENAETSVADSSVTYNSSLSDWWDSLPNNWKLFFNDKLLPNGRVYNKPSEDALQYLKSIETISCISYYNREWKNNREYFTYYINSVDGLQNLFNLKELTISDCNLNQNSLETLGSLKSILKLDLSQNKIAALPLNYRLGNLIELNISNNLFESLDFLSNLPNLEILHCYSNKLTGTKGIERANRLRVLFIDKAVYDLPFVNSKLTDLSFEKVDFDSNTIVKLERA